MHLTRIELNLSSIRARGDLADPYEMHSTLSRAFSNPDAVAGATAPFLWRSESVRAGASPIVLVQSATEPRWAGVQARSGDWATSIASKTVDIAALTTSGAQLRFRLRANPTVTRQGRRHALIRVEEQLAWIHRQGERLGFVVAACEAGSDQRIVTRKRSGAGVPVVVHAVSFEGLITVVDPIGMTEAIRQGLGHAKFLGLGLLSVAPATP